MGELAIGSVNILSSYERPSTSVILAAFVEVTASLYRMRPILNTAATTLIGLIPLSLNGDEMWRPMANVIIFGLAFSTLLSLVLCPILYSVFYKINFSQYKTDHE